MTLTLPQIRPLHVLILLLLGLAAAMLVAQIEGDRGVPPIASGGDFEVSGVKVDVAGPNAEAARYAGWRQAQRLAWKMLWTRTNGGTGAPGLSDSQLEAIVSGIEIQSEQAGPTRYIATLGVLFDRARAGQILGVQGRTMRSPPLLVIPILWQGGVATSYESVNEWQKGWARFRTGDSAIDYVRVAGNAADPVLLNAAQTGRRSRNWWRVLLDQYGAADVVIPIARLDYAWPGGPVTGRFAARYGPDNALIGTFTLRASNASGVQAMIDQAIQRIDGLYTQALNDGTLRPDPSLIIEEPVDPDALAIENASEAIIETAITPLQTGIIDVTIQYDTPNVASVSQGEATVQGIAGVRAASTSSLALGGTSVMAVRFEGTIDALRAALQSRGYTVAASGSTLRISRRAQAAPGAQ
ncbi:heavy-metal-associated domain-containing protein [Sphingobium algorifonticola]|uniref:Heavy-metal-associated domain-containing protein n=2 Tax=Sphingobium algorifonticola TaxID=2008318 RepID=A0A437J9Q8_9SPHN|nr:heavy-metal-associated domain-containing protein [Sphingobium algorifonticola]